MYQIPDFAGSSSGGSSQAIFNPMELNLGSNQYMNYPSMPSSQYQGVGAMTSTAGTPPGIVPSASPIPISSSQQGLPSVAAKSGGFGLQGGAATGPSIDPQFTNLWSQFLQSQMGQGVTPFDLSAILPSTGQATSPGTLTAPMNPLMQSLQDFYLGQSSGVSGVPGTSGPLSYVLPMWQSEVSAMNQPIQQQLANIKEQFGAQGALGSSEMGTALANYGSQTALNEQSLLGQLTMQALPGMQQQASTEQTLDQQSIQNLYNEFIRTQPQYNPLLGAEGSLATTFPPIYTKQGGVGQALIGSAGGIVGGLASLLGAL